MPRLSPNKNSARTSADAASGRSESARWPGNVIGNATSAVASVIKWFEDRIDAHANGAISAYRRSPACLRFGVAAGFTVVLATAVALMTFVDGGASDYSTADHEEIVAFTVSDGPQAEMNAATALESLWRGAGMADSGSHAASPSDMPMATMHGAATEPEIEPVAASLPRAGVTQTQQFYAPAAGSSEQTRGERIVSAISSLAQAATGSGGDASASESSGGVSVVVIAVPTATPVPAATQAPATPPVPTPQPQIVQPAPTATPAPVSTPEPTPTAVPATPTPESAPVRVAPTLTVPAPVVVPTKQPDVADDFDLTPEGDFDWDEQADEFDWKDFDDENYWNEIDRQAESADESASADNGREKPRPEPSKPSPPAPPAPPAHADPSFPGIGHGVNGTSEDNGPAANDQTQPGVAPEQTPDPALDVLVEPTPEVTPEPTAAATQEVTPSPIAEPTTVPAPEVTPSPTPEPTNVPTETATPAPTASPTAVPTAEPTPEPTPDSSTGSNAESTATPTETPVQEPTPSPTPDPTAVPTETPASGSDSTAGTLTAADVEKMFREGLITHDEYLLLMQEVGQ